MNIQQLLQKNPEGMAIVSLADLREFAIGIIEEVLTKCKEQEQPKAEDIYYTSEETAKMLHVSKSTLWRWQQCGYLLPVKIGSLNHYSKADIDAIFNKTKSV